jgi:hypothetical protein
MLARAQAVQDPVVARIRALLLAARPQIQADGRALDVASSEQPPGPGEPYLDPGEAIAKMRKHLQSLRASVLALPAGGPGAASARDLTAQTLLETDQSLDKLAQSYAAADPAAATALRDESVRLIAQASGTSVKAGTALGIPWPL